MSHRTFSDPHGTSTEARQFLLDNHGENRKSKRHGTLKRVKRLAAMKRARIKHKNAKRSAAIRRHKAAVAAYWSGERDEHPELSL